MKVKSAVRVTGPSRCMLAGTVPPLTISFLFFLSFFLFCSGYPAGSYVVILGSTRLVVLQGPSEAILCTTSHKLTVAVLCAFRSGSESQLHTKIILVMSTLERLVSPHTNGYVNSR